MLNKTFGIYVIKNKLNNKVYVGSTTRNFTKRWSIHKVLLRNNKHHSPRLQNSWNKNGEENFSFEVLEAIQDKDLVIERENYYLEFYKSYDKKFGYNICKTAHKDAMSGKSFPKEKHGMFNKTHTPESRKKISDNHADFNGDKNGRAKLNWTLVREIREKYKKNEYTLLMLANEYNVGLSTVSHVIKNETWREDAEADTRK